jgi:hypothetical protein
MRILKRWNSTDEVLKEQGLEVGWFETSLETCLEFTEGSEYYVRGSVLGLLEEGVEIRTPAATYKGEKY